jgi:hypothetical protein
MSKTSDATEILRRHYLGEGGLTDSLRPYVGAVDAGSLTEVLDAVRLLKSEAESGGKIPNASLGLIFYITNTVRRWALDKDSTLVQNSRIEAPEWQRLMKWVIEVEEEYRALLGVLEERDS